MTALDPAKPRLLTEIDIRNAWACANWAEFVARLNAILQGDG